MEESPRILLFTLFLSTQSRTLTFQILEQKLEVPNDIARIQLKEYVFPTSGPFKLAIYSHPALYENAMYLRGSERAFDLESSSIPERHLCKHFPSVEHYAQEVLNTLSTLGAVRGTLVPDQKCEFEIWKRR